MGGSFSRKSLRDLASGEREGEKIYLSDRGTCEWPAGRPRCEGWGVLRPAPHPPLLRGPQGCMVAGAQLGLLACCGLCLAKGGASDSPREGTEQCLNTEASASLPWKQKASGGWQAPPACAFLPSVSLGPLEAVFSSCGALRAWGARGNRRASPIRNADYHGTVIPVLATLSDPGNHDCLSVPRMQQSRD